MLKRGGKKSGIPLLARFRTQLFILILLVFVPAFLLAIHTNFKEREAARQNTREKTIAAARLVAAQQENFIKNAEQLLTTVSQFSFLVLQNDRAFAQVHISNLQKLSPDYVDIGLIEADGTLFCSSLATNASTNLSGWSCFQQTMRSKRFSVGDLEKGLANQPTLDFGLPVFDEKGQLKRVFYASLDLDRIKESLEKIAPAMQESAITIFDRRGNVLARRSNHASSPKINSRIDSFVHRSLQGADSFFEARGLDGVQKLFGISTVNDGWKKCLWIAVGVPTRTLFAQADRTLWGNIGIMLVVALLAFIGAYFYAEKFFLQPLNSLIDQASEIAAGEWQARSQTPANKGELGQLSRSFNNMALRLKEQQTAIQTINAELEQRVRERTLQLEQASRELEAFSYSVSHDLRAPLRHIGGFVDLLRTELGQGVSAKGRRFLDVIADSARQMGLLIDELLVFSKMGRVEMQKTVVDPNTIVDEVLAGLSTETAGRNIIWEKAVLPRLQADPAMLRQVFVNLISNAIKYSKPRDPARIQIGFEEQGAETIVFVRDNGVGFDMQFANKLFGVFQRLHRSDEFEGTGIGLANVRRIIHRHGGRTWAEGKVNQGATFYFTLPKQNQKTEL